MTLSDYLDAMGILSCNVNPYLPALDDLGFSWGEMTALLDRRELFYCKAYRKRTVYLSPRVYFLLRQCRPRPALTGDAAALYALLRDGPPLETADLKLLSQMDAKRYQKAFGSLMEHLYATALENGTVLAPNWSTFRYGTAQAWEALAAPQPPSADPEGELRAILGRTLPEGEVSRLLRGA